MGAVVSSIAQPTLLVRAVEPLIPGAPLIFPEETAQRALASLPDGRLVDVKGNHYEVVLGEASADTAAAIVDFRRE